MTLLVNAARVDPILRDAAVAVERRLSVLEEHLEKVLSAWESWDGHDDRLDEACGQIYDVLDVVLRLGPPAQPGEWT